MAEYRIKVTTDELRDAANRFKACQQEITTAYNAMKADAFTLLGSWEGKASRAFVNSCTELINNISTSDATIAQAVTGLEKAAEIYDIGEGKNEGLGEGMTEAPGFSA